MAALDDLMNEIFDGKKSGLYPDFEGWVRGSRRFKAFAQVYRGKIRSKLRHLNDQGSMKDLHAELVTAATLLRDERFTLEYEKYAASRERGPDFTGTFKTHIFFNVEVRRIGRTDTDAGDAGAHIAKLMAVMLDKVDQMRRGMVNLLWLVDEGEIAQEALARALQILRQLAENKDEDLFIQLGFKSAGDFLQKYRRVSGIVLLQPGESTLWLNPLAQHKVPPEIATAIQRLLKN